MPFMHSKLDRKWINGPRLSDREKLRKKNREIEKVYCAALIY